MTKSEKTKQPYKTQLKNLQIQLVRLQRHIIKNDLQLLVIFEGRDAAGKDGMIKRITEHLSPRERWVNPQRKIPTAGTSNAMQPFCRAARKWYS